MTETMTAQQYRAKAKKPNKYRNKHVWLIGAARVFNKKEAARLAKVADVPALHFDSIAEADRHCELLRLQHAGHIRGLLRQPRFPLTVGEHLICTYVGDWWYEELSPPHQRTAIWSAPVTVVEDRKGAITPDFKIKWALAKALHPEIEWRLS